MHIGSGSILRTPGAHVPRTLQLVRPCSNRSEHRACQPVRVAAKELGTRDLSNEIAYKVLKRVTDTSSSSLILGSARSPATSCATTDPVLDRLYDNLDSSIFYSKGGFVIPKSERAAIDATGGSATYGETLADGVDQLIEFMCLDKNSSFYDLGCGRGRTVLQVALHTNVKEAVGIELSASRLEQAGIVLQQLHQEGYALRPVEFQHADLSTCDLTTGTHFYLCSTAFQAGICRSIAERLAASPNFQVLLTSRVLPTQPYLYKLGEVPCSYTYTGNGQCFVYVKNLMEAPVEILRKFLCKDGVCALPSMQPFQLGISLDEPVVAEAADMELRSRFITLSVSDD